MPSCPSPCSGNCSGDTCVCVILGSDEKCKGVSNFKELMAAIDGADEVRMWADDPFLEELREEIGAGKSLTITTVKEDDGVVSIRKK